MVVAARLAFAQPCLAAPPVLHKCNLLMNVERVPLSSIFHGSNKYILVDRTLNVIKKGERFRLLECVIFLNEKKEGSWDEIRVSKFDFENCVIFLGERKEVMQR